MSKHKISERRLRQEMTEYYSSEAFECSATKSGKVNRVLLKPGQKKPVLFTQPPRPPRPKIMLKRRRNYSRD